MRVDLLFLHEVLDVYKRQIVVIFACIAILISLLGLLAMSTYFILQRSQEVAIRKVFGSDNREIRIAMQDVYKRQQWQDVAI